MTMAALNALVLACAILLSVVSIASASARKSEPKASGVGCQAVLDSLHAQFKQGDPRFIYAPVTESGCTPAQKHDAYYHQGLGLMFLGRPADAALHFRAALDHDGAYREDARYQFWKSSRQSGDEATAKEAVFEMYAEFPTSRYLSEMLDVAAPQATAPTRPPRPREKRSVGASKPWQLSTMHQVTGHHEPGYRRDYTEHRVQTGWRYKTGKHFFNPTLQMGTVFDFAGPNPAAWDAAPELSTVNGELGFSYMHQWLFATATTGFAYDYLRRAYANFAGTALEASIAGWNIPQFGFSLGARLPLAKDDLSMMAFASANRFHEQFQNLSLHLSASLDSKPISHQVSASLERMFISTPSVPEIDSTHLEPYAPATGTDVTSMHGLWGYEAEYRLEWRSKAWRAGLTTTLREERRILKNGADSVWVVSDLDPTTRFAFGGDAHAVERRALATLDLGFKPHRSLSLRASARTGYMWVQSSARALKSEGGLIRLSMHATTHF
jgi:hypothetical protein